MNVTLSWMKGLRKARRVAESMGISLNQAVRRFLEKLAGDDSVDADIAELNEPSALSNGRSRGWRFDRAAIHGRRHSFFDRNVLVCMDHDASEKLHRAIDLHRLHGLSFWDALVVRAALVSGCSRLLSEDLQTGRRFEGLEVVNPFS